MAPRPAAPSRRNRPCARPSQGSRPYGDGAPHRTTCTPHLCRTWTASYTARTEDMNMVPAVAPRGALDHHCRVIAHRQEVTRSTAREGCPAKKRTEIASCHNSEHRSALAKVCSHLRRSRCRRPTTSRIAASPPRREPQTGHAPSCLCPCPCPCPPRPSRSASRALPAT